MKGRWLHPAQPVMLSDRFGAAAAGRPREAPRPAPSQSFPVICERVGRAASLSDQRRHGSGDAMD